MLTRKSELETLLDLVDLSSSSLDELSGHLLWLWDPSGALSTKKIDGKVGDKDDGEVGDKDDVSRLSSGGVCWYEEWLFPFSVSDGDL